MKKIFTISSLIILFSLFLTGCYRRDAGYNEDYWLSKQKGEVVYSDSYCNYYVVQTYNSYTVLRAYGGYKPFEGSIVYGDFGYGGTRDIYNSSTGIIFTGTVTDYGLSFDGAQQALDYYCPLGGKSSSSNSFRIKN
ncbi:MAG: hypothetical protein Q8941_06185 [Bacteroidota bacterium]|nr:hypothetical protein [Bacteroidota bacterium]